MRKLIALPALSSLALLLAACAHEPNANLEKARSDYSALQAQPQATQLAALETKDAGDWLSKADKAYRDGEKQQDVDQLAYLTQQRINLANQTIALKTAEGQLQNTAAQRTQARLDVRTQQLKDLQARQTQRGTLVTFGDVLFDLDRADLKPEASHNIQQLASYLQQNPERKVLVEGYTDSSGSAGYNQSLSERRADSVRMALLAQGVDPARVTTRGYGKDYPVASNASSSGRAQNRRVEVTISNDAKPVAPRSSVDSDY
ncbi:Outer membrane protein OmpA [Pseudomonas delhiensis]|uniref:Outer membrane protein OmpA n=1 Tax=Pseudomonas delhiensis TaxID=366289 RepID=A0A239IMP2_9PSED|nr:MULTISPECIES: OmpA family protein [Pseudomonas]MED5606996.1 OmpA family protein [Pseudomonas sp. JH-2]SDI64958.1 Outer membrane protein OmpA [Pseudomonas delhiensis]SNS94835.1 Outer membrane protein OmpA [Pseudomonas delhiensis]